MEQKSITQQAEEKIDKFVDDYKDLVETYNEFLVHSSGNKEPFLEFQNRFNNIHHKLIDIKPFLVRKRMQFTDRSLSARKAEAAANLYGKEEGQEKSWQRAESKAASSKDYLDAINEKAIWEELYEKISTLEANLDKYSMEISQRLRIFERKNIEE